jgi:hypothetical protein
MFRRLFGAGSGHAMSPWQLCWPKVWQISARAKPKPSVVAANTPSMALLNDFISSI